MLILLVKRQLQLQVCAIATVWRYDISDIVGLQATVGLILSLACWYTVTTMQADATVILMLETCMQCLRAFPNSVAKA